MSGVLKKTLVDFVRSAQRHAGVVSIIALIAAVLLVSEAIDGRALEIVSYLGAMVLSAAIVDVSIAFFGKPRADLPVWAPRIEIAVAAPTYLLAAATLAYRFSIWYPPHNLFSRLVFLAALLFFGFQIALALFLLLRGYGFQDLGIRFWGFTSVPLIMMPCMALVAIATPLRSVWSEAYHSFGGSILGWIETGLLMAALPEEFFRMFWQTRTGKLLNNAAAGWLVASLLWASLHWFIFSQGRTHLQTLFMVLDIIPYGLLLGYVTQRTQSILPATLLHATKFVWLGGLG